MKTYLFLILLLLFSQAEKLIAQTVKFVASAPKVVYVGEQFKISYSINQKPDNFVQPDFGTISFRGPSTSSSSSVSMVNGKVTQSVSFEYIYYASAPKEGKYTIGPAKIKVGNTEYSSNILELEALKGSSSGAAQGGSANNGNSAGINKNDIFAKLILSKNTAYVGEPILARVKIFTKVSLAGFDEQPKMPSYSGFLVENISASGQVQLEQENVNGQIYNTADIQQVLLFPQRSGEIKIDPARLSCVVRQQYRPRSFFDSGVRDLRVEIETEPVSVTINQLPLNGKPVGFSGAVGKFKIGAKTDKTEVLTNEAITLTVEVSGTGNLKLFETPKIDFPNDFETYKPEVNVNEKTSASGSTGVKSFKYLVIPRHAGNFRIPPVQFSYFDIESKTYKILQTQEFNISVEKGKDATGNVQYYSGGKEQVKTIDVDIRHIKTGESAFKNIDSTFTASTVFYLIYAISFLLFVIISLLKRKQIKESANIAGMKNKKASKISRQRLRRAANHLKNNETEAFYNEVLTALWGYLSDKLNISPADLRKDNISEMLEKKSIASELISRVVSLIETCEFAKYAPTSATGERDKIYNEASTLISDLDSKLR